MENRRVEHIALADISLGEYANMRVIEARSIGLLARDIAENGIEEPLEVLKSGAGYVLLAGIKTLRAAWLCGFTHVPCRIRGIQSANTGPSPYALIEKIERETAPSAFIRKRTVPVIKDVRFIANTLKNGAEALQKGCVNASFYQTENENGTVFTLKIVR